MINFSLLTVLDSATQKVIIFFVFFIGWSFLFLIINCAFQFKSLNPRKLADTKNRIVSIIHGIVTFIWASYYYLPYPVYNEPNTFSQNVLIALSLGYSAYDLIACVYYNIADTGLFIHHICCAVGFGTAFYMGYGAIDSIGGLFIAEISNFPMHLRCLLRNFQLKMTKSYQLSENLYFALYIIFRGILGPFILLYPCLTASNSPILVKIVCFLLIGQSMYYIFTMFGLINKKLKQYKELKQKKIDLFWFSENPQVNQLSFYRKKEEQKIF